MSLLDLWNPPKPPEPKNVAREHVLMRTSDVQEICPEPEPSITEAQRKERRRILRRDQSRRYRERDRAKRLGK